MAKCLNEWSTWTMYKALAITHYGFIPPHPRHRRELRAQTPTLPAPRPRNHVPKFPRLIHFTNEYDTFISSTAACLLPPSIVCALSAATLEELQVFVANAFPVDAPYCV
ncbi:unnamed protein product [Musa hybrid cultivar]